MSPRQTLPRRMRLSGARQFAAVYDAKARINLEPLLISSRPNELGHARLGLSVPRRVGTAVARNRIKRLLREAFRLTQRHWPSKERSYDVVIGVRPHAALPLEQYQSLLREAMERIDQLWIKRQSRQNRPPPPDDQRSA